VTTGSPAGDPVSHWIPWHPPVLLSLQTNRSVELQPAVVRAETRRTADAMASASPYAEPGRSYIDLERGGPQAGEE